MATMAALMSTSSFSTTPPPHTSAAAFHSRVPSPVNFKSSPRISAHGHGSSHVFSGATVFHRAAPMHPDSFIVRVRSCSDTERESSADDVCSSASDLSSTGLADWFSSCRELPLSSNSRRGRTRTARIVFRCSCTSRGTQGTVDHEDSAKDVDEDPPSGGVAIAIKVLQFYKREISPILPGSCRFVPTCSEYGMQAFKKYGVVKGAILTAWRLSRCNPLGGSGFDPPRWFDEPRPPPY